MSQASQRTRTPEHRDSRLPATERGLVRALARRCEGRTALVGARRPELERELRARSVDLRVVATEVPGTAGKNLFDTVVLLGLLEYCDERDHPTLIGQAWRLISSDGRLIVCVPNEDLVDDPRVEARFTRRGLKRLLQSIDRPHLMKDQPHRWLAMYLDARPRLDHASRERHRVIAGLCRGRVIELGCAHGHLSDSIARRGMQVEGVDKSRLKVFHARKMFPHVTFRQADILELRVVERFDTVVLAEVLEHVDEATGSRMLAKAWDLVAEGGRLIVSVPNEDCVPHPNHVRSFGREDLVALLERFGARPTPVADQPFKWLLAYLDRT